MHNRKWIGDKLWYLLNLEPKELRIIFPEQTWSNLKNKRKQYRRKIKEGTEMPPRRPADYERGESPENIRDRLNTAPVIGELAVDQLIEQQDREALHRELDTVLDQLNVNPALVKGFRVSQWDGMIKNNEGEIETRKLRGIQLVAEARDFEPKWDIVRRVESEPTPFNQERKFKLGEYRREAILPDLQIGYRRYEDGSIDPFHDERAIDVALQIIKEVQPSRVILLGDFLDLPDFSRFLPEAAFAQTVNMAIQYGHNLLKTIREISPDSKLVLLEGNHDRRLENQIRQNFMKAYGIRRANEQLPVLSIPYLLALDELGVEYVQGYPAGRYFITPTLQCIHGEIVRKGATSKAVTDAEGVSTIHGHTHRWESYAKTVRTHDGARQTYAYSLGTLSRIDGAVPSVHGSTDVQGKPLVNYEDWQQMIAIIDHNGKSFSLNPVMIDTLNDYQARFENETYRPLVKRKRK